MRTPRTPVAIYARYSTDKQDACSIEDQIRRCREYAERLGYEVIAEFADAAISGAHTDRAQLRRMLDAATATKHSPFRAVIVDDLSRLSRDIGDTHAIVFVQLAGAGVKLLDTGGLDSEADSGEMNVAMRSIINREYIRGVAKQTHRGLEGRARTGFWTGGKVYGYSTRREENPTDSEHPRMVSIIDPEEAVIVRRIYELFIGGAGLKSIADTLNRDSVRAPHDNGKGNKGARGWTHSTIRNVLRNERYIGRWSWNTTKWIPGTNKKGEAVRRRKARPESEHVLREMPELAIIDMATWRRVQAQLRRRAEKGVGRPPGTGKAVYLVSGLLRCGACGNSMSIVGGRKLPNGTRCVTFGCTAYYTRGSSICGNNLTISEKRITFALLESLRELFTAPEVVERLTKSIAAKVEKFAKPTSAKVTAGMVAEVEGRIRQLTETLAVMPASAALLQKLGDEERRLAELKAAKRSTEPRKSIKAPTASQVRGFLSDLVGTFEADPVAGRDALVDMLSPVTLTPKTAPRGYECRAVFRLPRTLEAVGSAASVLKKSSSGGRI